MDYRVLGPLEARAEEGPARLGGAKQRALLAVLLLHAGEVVSSERLIDELWGERPPPSAHKLVQTYVSGLRRALNGDGPIDGASALVTRPPGYALELNGSSLDLVRFEELLAAARASAEHGSFADAERDLTEALALWRGSAVGDVKLLSTAAHEAERLNELRLEAILRRIEVRLELGQHAQVVGELEALAAAHPFHERIRELLILALYRSGRQREALAAYRSARQALVDELGIEPGEAMRRLELAILQRDPALEFRPPNGARRAVRPTLRRRLLLIAGVATALTGTAAAIALSLGSGGSPVQLRPDTIGALDPATGRVERVTDVGARPTRILPAFGSLWVANYDDRTVSRVALGSHRIMRTIGVGSTPTGLGAGDGAIWVTEGFAGRLVRIDPRTNRVDSTVDVGADPTGVAYGFGSLWVTDAGAGTLARLDPTTGRVIARVRVGAGPVALTIGFGSVWVSNGLDRTLSRVDPRSERVIRTVGLRFGPGALASGAGAVWVANPSGDRLSRVDPRTGSLAASIAVGDDPGGVAVAGGDVWVANMLGATLVRVDPKANRITTALRLRAEPEGVASGYGKLWLTVHAL